MSDLWICPLSVEVLPWKGDFFRFTGVRLASKPLFRYTSIAMDHLQ